MNPLCNPPKIYFRITQKSSILRAIFNFAYDVPKSKNLKARFFSENKNERDSFQDCENVILDQNRIGWIGELEDIIISMI